MQAFQITNTNHRNLDGLRALGILMVIFSHFFGEYINLTLFWTSIDLLFALSGLLITGILIETLHDPRYFKKFYMRRILRIFPVYYLLVLLFVIYVYGLARNESSFRYFSDNIGYFLTYTQNWYFISTGMPVAGHLNHTWSLAIDEQIYLFWPFLVWVCRSPRKLIYLCGGTVLFSMIFRLWYNHFFIPAHPSPHPFPYFHNTLCRIDAFAAGSLLYCLLRFKNEFLSGKKMLVLLLLTTALLLACGWADGGFGREGALISDFGCTLAGLHFTTWLYIAITRKWGWLNAFFSNRLMVYIGRISYSLYVFHFFLLVLLTARIRNGLQQFLGISNQWLALLICLGITFLVSILSFEYFEKPIVRLKKRFSYKN